MLNFFEKVQALVALRAHFETAVKAAPVGGDSGMVVRVHLEAGTAGAEVRGCEGICFHRVDG